MTNPNINISQDFAEEIAIKAVQFLASSPEILGSFLATAGVGPGDIKQAIASPDFLAGALDFLMQDESILLEFAESMQIAPKDVVKARIRYPGADNDLVCNH